MNWPTFAETAESAALRNLLSELVTPAAARAGTSAGSTDRRDLAAEILAAPAPRRRALVATRVRELVVRTLGLPTEFALDPRQGLRNVGLDSLMAVELRNSLQRILGRPLPSTLLFDFPTVESLSGYLLDAVLETPEKEDGRSMVHDGRGSEGEISEDEAEDLLKAELAQIRAERSGEDR